MKTISLLFIGILLTSCVEKQDAALNIRFNHEDKDKSLCDFVCSNPKTNIELTKLKTKYHLDSLTRKTKSNVKKTLILLNWTHSRWTHNGSNRPKNNSALGILREAKKGKKFRCVEYGIVLSAALNSIGIPARTLGLKTKNVETAKSGAGHVVTEAYIPELRKWIFLDPQMNYIPFLDKIPLNAVEYQHAIVHHRTKIDLENLNGKLNKKKSKSITDWISKYLFYFDVRFDLSGKKEKCNGKSKLMLVPIGEKNPEIFQIKHQINNCIYTNNIKDFYKPPKIINPKP